MESDDLCGDLEVTLAAGGRHSGRALTPTQFQPEKGYFSLCSQISVGSSLPSEIQAK